MLLELLSDFQISIPELGRIEAKTQPVVLLTSNNTRELTEALKRRCLYLWLDYPELEHELEIVRLHSPELDETLARKLVEIVQQVRELDLKKPPSIAESIDWARARCCCSAPPTSTSRRSGETMSVIVKHRTDLDTVAARVGVKLEPAARPMPGPPRDPGRRIYGGDPRARSRRRSTASCWPSPRSSARRAWRSAPPRCSTRSRRSSRSRGPTRPTSRRRSRPRWPSPRRPPGVRARVRPLLLPRHRGRGGPPRHHRGAAGDGATASDVDLDTLRQQIAAALRDGVGRRAAGPRPARRSPRSAAARARACSASTCSGSAARSACEPSPSPTCPTTTPAARASARDQLRRFEQHLRRELERDLIERTASLPPKRPLSELDRALPTGPIQDLAAGPPGRRPAQATARHPGPRAQGPQAPRPRRRPPDDAGLAADRRRADRAASIAPGVRADPRSSCCATCRPASPAPARSSCRSCTPCTTRSASSAVVRVHRADLRGDRGVRARARLPRRQRGDLAGRRRGRHLRLHRLRPRVDWSSWR